VSRFAKSDAYNSLKDARTGSLGLPAGTTTERDPTPQPGEIRWNTTNGRLEFYDGSAYREVAARGNVTITKDSFTGDGSTASYVLSITPTSPNNILVFVGNVYQESTVNYTLSGATLTFTSAPPIATNIVVLHGFDSTGNTTAPVVNNTITVNDEGVLVLPDAQAINFIGAIVTASDAGSGVVNVTTSSSYDFAVYAGGLLTSSEAFFVMKAVSAFQLPTNLSGSFARALVASTGTADISISKNGAPFGTITYTSSDTATISSSATSFAIGDVLTFTGPAIADPTLAGINITVKGARV
jgi:hypothetical protein